MLMGDPRNRARIESEALQAQARRAQAKNDVQRFVTFALGSSRFALDTGHVKEVVMSERVYSFPHTMPTLDGVLVRRGSAIPVCNVVSTFGDPPQYANNGRAGNPGSCSRYLIAQCSYRGASYSVAIPVSGDCELVQGEREDPPQHANFRRAGDPDAEESSSVAVTNVTFVSGLLRTASGTVPLLDMNQIVAHCIQPQHASGVSDLPALGGLG